jgi:hypothetical protein
MKMKLSVRKMNVKDRNGLRQSDFVVDPRTTSNVATYDKARRAPHAHVHDVDPGESPDVLVKPYSVVRLTDLGSGSRRTCTLVDPDAASLFPDGISFLDPLGSSLVGCQVGDIVKCWELARCRDLRIDEIQSPPEPNGVFES